MEWGEFQHIFDHHNFLKIEITPFIDLVFLRRKWADNTIGVYLSEGGRLNERMGEWMSLKEAHQIIPLIRRWSIGVFPYETYLSTPKITTLGVLEVAVSDQYRLVFPDAESKMQFDMSQ